MPEPQPSCCGSISQGMPLRKTNTMPVRHALSSKRGLPPWGFAGARGRNGSISSHNPFGTSSAVIGGLSLPFERDVRRFTRVARKSRVLLETLNTARGSLAEVETQIMLADDVGHLAFKDSHTLLLTTSELGRILNGLIASTKSAA